MSAPATLVCAAAAVCLGIPIIAASSHLEAAHRAAAAADAAALAAADAAAGFVADEPCELAEAVVQATDTALVSCVLDAELADARVEVAVGGALGTVTASAHAGPPPMAAVPGGTVGANGWAWPSAEPGITQGFHDGYSIDLRAAEGAPLFAPYDGVVVAAGADGNGPPAKCVAEPSWWHGPNHTVMIRHEYRGLVLFSSHNHVAPGSPTAFGMKPGTVVRSGQVVALAGMSGCTSGPHTHFTLSTTQSNAFPDVNPYLYIGGGEGA
ncbi:peptidoglycan DD-metalloendopeptidase family protein [Leucobacter sp. NPDC077196]|uniref:M23 family metallopeptidase n=1 Tax=Leucobacter sp. NPDC077196 TaxID=3154959 RepID=UPI003416079D